MRSRMPADAAPARMGTLAKLPIFLDLQGKRAVLAGGSAAACWKAELLEAAGATVHVYALELSPEMAERIAPDGRIIHHARPWATDVFDGAAIALADIDADEEARAFYCAGRAAGVPVNVIDKPAFCQFQFGSIVNRSPVIIGISTDGAAPILGQAIRRRIETLLPPALSQWGQLARDIRDSVMATLAKGAPRRAFWEAFAERSFGPAPTSESRTDMAALINDIGAGQSVSKGRVTLVGAGPGDAELLTLKAVRALQSADVILFDDLVSDEVLELARREAKRMLVGKRGQRESCAQADINALMVQLAKQGKHVVRLKSGDPMIFGRAGEEIAELEAQGIAIDVVPGITTALAVASSLGVSLTHRDHAQSVRFVTGHTRDGELSDDLDWAGLADPSTTLVFYMGGRTSPAIATRLIAAGLPSSTPVVVISGATRPDETRWLGDLTQLADGMGLPSAGKPVLIGVGRVFATANAGAANLPSPTLLSSREPEQPLRVVG
jgi:uroporphyrin-III C-methyltransferase / precorrin-2 dehydrogenase / sirohydrochlorin ferrochelatase